MKRQCLVNRSHFNVATIREKIEKSPGILSAIFYEYLKIEKLRLSVSRFAHYLKLR
jgi:hypothetical protein